MALEDIINDFLNAKGLIPIQADATDMQVTESGTFFSIPVMGDASQTAYTGKTSPGISTKPLTAAEKLSVARKARRGKATTGADGQTQKLTRRQALKMLENQQKTRYQITGPVLPDSLLQDRSKISIEQQLLACSSNAYIDEETGELKWRMPEIKPKTYNLFFNPDTDRYMYFAADVPENTTRMRIFVRLGHDKLSEDAKRPCGAEDEHLITDDYGPALGKRLAELGHTVLVYRSFPGQYTTKGKANRAGVDSAKSFNPNLFISCHANSFTSSLASGTEVLYNTVPIAKRYAQVIQDAIVDALGTSRRAARDFVPDELSLTAAENIPAVIIEPIFVTSTDDLAKYDEYKTSHAATGGLGGAIAEAVNTFIQNEYPPQ